MSKRMSRRKNTLKRKTLKRKTIKKYTGGGFAGLSLTKNKDRWKSRYEKMKEAWETEVRGALSNQYKYAMALAWLKKMQRQEAFLNLLGHKDLVQAESDYITSGLAKAENLPRIKNITAM